MEAVSIDLPILRDREFHRFQELIVRGTGICLKGPKRSLVASRLGKRLRHFGFTGYDQYYDYLLAEGPGGAEHQEMVNCITTNKTQFFRESHHFDFLRERLIPEAMRRASVRGTPRQLRIWSAACSTGEEPYSIAMTLEGTRELASWNLKILASDIDTDVLRRAEAGLYPRESIAELPDTLARRYLLRGRGEREGLFQIKNSLQRIIRFRQINFVAPAWPIRARFDAIFCRNVIIYFDRETQRRLFERMAGYLKPEGYLIVGHSENLHWMNHLLDPVQHTIYRVRRGQQPVAANA